MAGKPGRPNSGWIHSQLGSFWVDLSGLLGDLGVKSCQVMSSHPNFGDEHPLTTYITW